MERELSEFEKRIERNRREKLAYIESLKLQELKDGLRDSVKPQSKSKIVRTHTKRPKATEVEIIERRKSERSNKNVKNLSEKAIFEQVFETNHRKFFPPRNQTERNSNGRYFRKLKFVSYKELRSDEVASDGKIYHIKRSTEILKKESKSNVILLDNDSLQLISKEDIIVSSKEFIEKIKMMKCKNLSVVVSRELADRYLFERNIPNTNDTVTKSEVHDDLEKRSNSETDTCKSVFESVLFEETQKQTHSKIDTCESFIKPVLVEEKQKQFFSSIVANKSDSESLNDSSAKQNCLTSNIGESDKLGMTLYDNSENRNCSENVINKSDVENMKINSL